MATPSPDFQRPHAPRAAEAAVPADDDATLDLICARLNMDPRTKAAARELLKALRVEDAPRLDALPPSRASLWAISALFLSARNVDPDTGRVVAVNRVTVTHLLRAADGNFLALESELDHAVEILNAAGMGERAAASVLRPVDPAIVDAIEGLCAQYCLGAVLAAKLLQICKLLFPADATLAHDKSTFMSCVWYTFLVAKTEMVPFPRKEDVLQLLDLLVCILAHCLDQCSSYLLHADHVAAVESTDLFKSGSKTAALRHYICEKFRIDASHIEIVYESYWRPFLSEMEDVLAFDKRDRPRPRPGNMEALNLKYEDIYLSADHCGIDERLFVIRDPQVSTPGPARTPASRTAAVSAPAYAASTPVRKSMASRPVPMPLSPARSARPTQRADRPPASPLAQGTSAAATTAAGRLLMRTPDAAGMDTPVRRAITAASSLQAFLANNGSDGPGPHLEGICRSMQPGQPLETITNVLTNIDDAFVKAFVETKGEAARKLAIHLMQQARRLFFVLMEHSVIRERGRGEALRRLLSNDAYFRALMCLSLEVLLASRLTTMTDRANAGGPQSVAFPWVLKAINVPALTLWKVLEDSVRAVLIEFQDVIEHLKGVEMQSLLHLMWDTGSPLLRRLGGKFPSVRETEPGILAARTSPGSQQKLMPADGDSGELPAKRSLGFDQSGRRVAIPRSGSQDTAPSELSEGGDSDSDSKRSLDEGSASSTPTAEYPRDIVLVARKFYAVMYKQLERLLSAIACHIGDSVDALRPVIWTLFEKCITNHTSLFSERHADHILLSCIYATFRLKRQDPVPFRTIVKAYSSLSGTCKRTMHSVLLQKFSTIEARDAFLDSLKHHRHSPSTNELVEGHYYVKGNIVQFYNSVFLTTAKKELESLADVAASGGLAPRPGILRREDHMLSPQRRLTSSMPRLSAIPSPASGSLAGMAARASPGAVGRVTSLAPLYSYGDTPLTRRTTSHIQQAGPSASPGSHSLPSPSCSTLFAQLKAAQQK